MPPRPYTRSDMRATAKGLRALELHAVGGYTYREVAAAIGCSTTHAYRLVRGSLMRVAAQRDQLAEYVLDKQLHAIALVQREAFEAATMQCGRCHGHGRRNGRLCGTCSGSGYMHQVGERMQALQKFLQALEAESRLVGLGTGGAVQLQHQHVHDVRVQVGELQGEELAIELQKYLHAIDAEEQSRQQVQVLEAGPQ